MPLSKARMRERKRMDRSVKPKSNLDLVGGVKPNVTPHIAHVNPGNPKIDELRNLIKGIEQGGVKSNQGGVVSNPPPNIPPTKLDADGRIIPEYW